MVTNLSQRVTETCGRISCISGDLCSHFTKLIWPSVHTYHSNQITLTAWANGLLCLATCISLQIFVIIHLGIFNIISANMSMSFFSQINAMLDSTLHWATRVSYAERVCSEDLPTILVSNAQGLPPHQDLGQCQRPTVPSVSAILLITYHSKNHKKSTYYIP